MLAEAPILHQRCQYWCLQSSATNIPSRQSRHISSLSVWTLMLYGSISSTVTSRFLRYFSSILYGCLAPVEGSSNIITTTGPFDVSGIAAGVSVEGPIASVSARVRLVGGAGFAVAMASVCVLEAGIVSEVCGTAISAGLEATANERCAVVFTTAGAAPDGGSVRSSTGLDDSSSWVFSARDPAIACCGLLWAAVDAVEAMAAGLGPSYDVSGDSDCEALSEWTARGVVMHEEYGWGRRRGAGQQKSVAVGECPGECLNSWTGSWIDGRGNRARPGRASGTAPCSPPANAARAIRSLHQNRAIGRMPTLQLGKTPLGLEHLSSQLCAPLSCTCADELCISATISSACLAPQCAMFGSPRPACPCILPGRQCGAHALLAFTLASPTAAGTGGLLAVITVCTERMSVCRLLASVRTTQAFGSEEFGIAIFGTLVHST
jgi:hypothetical protein